MVSESFRSRTSARLNDLAERLKNNLSINVLLQTSSRLKVAPVLVGGILRDTVLGRECQDTDIAVAHSALDLAGELAEALKGTFVPLDETHGSARVVLESGESFDITDFRRDTLEDDCRARDLTCNALAAPLREFIEKGVDAVVDVMGAMTDIEAGLIRMTCAEALSDDPVRIMRVFRYAAQLGFDIEPKTLAEVAEVAPQLSAEPGERVWYEMRLITASKRIRVVLPKMLSTGVLQAIFTFLEHEELEAWVRRVSAVERMINQGGIYLPGYKAVAERISSFRLITILAALQVGRRIPELITTLRLSKRMTGRIMRIELALVSVRRLVYDNPVDLDFVYVSSRILLNLGEYRLAPWLIVAADGDKEKVFATLTRFEKVVTEKVMPVIDSGELVGGGELVQALGKKPGKWVAEVLEGIFYKRIGGKISTREQALEFAREYIERFAIE